MIDENPIKCIKECPAFKATEFDESIGRCMVCGTAKTCRVEVGWPCRLSWNIKVLAFRFGVREESIINEHDFKWEG